MRELDLHTTDTGSGTPILWIHGYPLSSAVFVPQLEIPGVRHIMPDLPGFGRSSPAEELTIADYARLLQHLLTSLGVDKAIVAGLSMGGYIALALARNAPELVSGLILIDTRETPDTDEARKGRYASIEKVEQEGTRPVIEAMLPKMLTKSAPQDVVDMVQRIMSASTPEGVTSALQAMAERDSAADLLPKLGIPVLIVVGEEDTLTPPSDSERMAAAIPNAKLVKIAGAAHLSNLEQPAAFNAAVSQFLRSV